MATLLIVEAPKNTFGVRSVKKPRRKAMTNQFSREQFEHAMRVFLIELNEKCADSSESRLRALPKFEPAIVEYMNDFREKDRDASTLLRLAFSYVDEYVHADWRSVADAAYSAYCLDSTK